MKTLEDIKDKSMPEPNSGCWLWLERLTRKSYGQLRMGGRIVSAHRVSYAIAKCDPSGKLVCHRCDTPACVNPDHLFLGDVKENTHDALNKGRLKSWGRPVAKPYGRGITFHRQLGKWQALVRGKYLGVFSTETEAEATATAYMKTLTPITK